MPVETRSAEELRVAIGVDLAAAGITVRTYTSENLDPPNASVVPGDPYLRKPTGDEAALFGMTRVGFDVLLLSRIAAEAQTTAELADELLSTAWAAVADWRPREASQPREIESEDGTRYMGSVIAIEHDTKEP